MTFSAQHTSALQILRLKGRVTPEVLAASLGVATADATSLLQTLLTSGAAAEAKGAYRLSPAGREQLQQAISAERTTVDQTALHQQYEAFHPINVRFKAITTDWQIRHGAPNDHSDATYDGQVLAALAALDAQFAPLLAQMVVTAPRLRQYPVRLAHALRQLQGGDATWFARPIMDSYHTVWFELHEDLIGLLGLSREAEAVAGRAE